MYYEITIHIYGAASLKPHSQNSLVHLEVKSRDCVYVCIRVEGKSGYHSSDGHTQCLKMFASHLRVSGFCLFEGCVTHNHGFIELGPETTI